MIGRVVIVVVFLWWSDAAICGPMLSQQRPRAERPQVVRPPQGSDLTPARPPIRDAVEGFFVNRIQRELRLSDEQFARVLPLLRRSLQRRSELAQRQVRVRNRLRQVLQQEGASNAQMAALRTDLDETDTALREVQEEFFTDIDPHLTEAQRANLRIVLPNLENRLRNMIERSRNAPTQPGSNDP